MEYFDVVDLQDSAEAFRYTRMGEREKLFVCSGSCDVTVRGETATVSTGAVIEVDDSDTNPYSVSGIEGHVRLIRTAGCWSDDIGGFGIFSMERGGQPDQETPVTYPKETDFDNHYHDCDEYWIGIEGRAVAVSEDRFYEIGPGDCLATGKGFHHDLPYIHDEPFRGVYFETTMEGDKRAGHLWEPVHGPAEPDMTRI